AHRLLPANTLIEHPAGFTDTTHLGRWSGIWQTASRPDIGDIHPPLGYLFVRGWGELFGFSETSLRSLSALASLAGILLLFLAARELHDEKIALWASLLMALAATQITFAQETKHYALLQFFALAAALALVRIEKRGPNFLRALSLTVMVLAVMLT